LNFNRIAWSDPDSGPIRGDSSEPPLRVVPQRSLTTVALRTIITLKFCGVKTQYEKGGEVTWLKI